MLLLYFLLLINVFFFFFCLLFSFELIGWAEPSFASSSSNKCGSFFDILSFSPFWPALFCTCCFPSVLPSALLKSWAAAPSTLEWIRSWAALSLSLFDLSLFGPTSSASPRSPITSGLEEDQTRGEVEIPTFYKVPTTKTCGAKRPTDGEQTDGWEDGRHWALIPSVRAFRTNRPIETKQPLR